jgi:hypothetical protein
VRCNKAAAYDAAMTAATDDFEADPDAPIHDARLWRDNGWTARVVKNNDDDGWAVEMTLAGHAEPALVGPWTMGRDKKNPKPLDTSAFNTLVKTAHEVVRGRVTVTLDVVPDEDDPHAWLAATDAEGGELGRVRVSANFRLTSASAQAWVEGGCGKPR